MRLGYSQGSHYWVNFYHHLASLIGGGGHSVVNSTQCDIFFYTFWNTKDIHKCRKGTILVFISGECWDTSKFQCSLLIDCKVVSRPSSSFLYYPFYALSFFERSTGVDGRHLIKSPSFQPRDVLRQKSKFCAFMYRYDVDFRVQLFDDINRYKPVDALGKSRNRNPNISTDRGQSTYMDNAVAKYKPYKFVICCENKRHPGYITEKLINGMLSQAIPIYLGAPDVAQHFNPKSFIDVGSFPTRAAALEYIRKVDQDDELYCSMLKEPWFVGNVPSRYFDPQYLRQAFQNLQPTALSSSRSRSRSRLRSALPTRIKSNAKRSGGAINRGKGIGTMRMGGGGGVNTTRRGSISTMRRGGIHQGLMRSQSRSRSRSGRSGSLKFMRSRLLFRRRRVKI